MAEATAVSPAGRISPGDTGIWNDTQAAAWQPITEFIKAQGAVPALQLAHAGRKASTAAPWEGGAPLSPSQGGWQTLSPSAIPFANFPVPKAMDEGDIAQVVDDFARAAERSLAAGFQVGMQQAGLYVQ